MPDDWMVVWRKSDLTSDLYGQVVGTDGTMEENSALVTSSGAQSVPALAGGQADGYHLLAWQDSRSGNADVYSNLMQWRNNGAQPQTTSIVCDYDPLYRLNQATYTGVLSGTYSYEYDASGNRVAYSSNVTTTESITYTYDAANRLTESVDLISSDTTTYDWDDAGRLITTTVAGNVSRLYSYSQDGDLLEAVVDGLTTTFAYNGNGNRLQMSVGVTTTTYLLDYAAGSRTLFEQGGVFADTKHYLYGYACLGELVDAGTANEEWRYYQRDGNSLVRQTTNETAAVTLAWVYSPEGGVIMGQEGPVTHLDCGEGAVYDWSTGLIFKNGGYFDPNTGIWITMSRMVIWNGRQPYPQNRRQRRQSKKWMLWLLLLLVVMVLAGCAPSPDPTIVVCPTPTTTPGTPAATPTLLPPPLFSMSTQPPITTQGPPPSLTPPPTSTPLPTNTPLPPTPFPPTPSVHVFPGDLASAIKERTFEDTREDIDIIPASKHGGGNNAAGSPVAALISGDYFHYPANRTTHQFEVIIKSGDFQLQYNHVTPLLGLSETGKSVKPGDIIGTLVNWQADANRMFPPDNGMAHLDLRLKEGYGESAELKDPSYLIIAWGETYVP